MFHHYYNQVYYKIMSTDTTQRFMNLLFFFGVIGVYTYESGKNVDHEEEKKK